MPLPLISLETYSTSERMCQNLRMDGILKAKYKVPPYHFLHQDRHLSDTRLSETHSGGNSAQRGAVLTMRLLGNLPQRY